ncbi:hypothetical protein BJP40_19980 [Streptomyces sp. CC53]|uniref:hypothetical protein n=1 Tax=unclassified Streptomyces TaxID=2593676 RepID=UPI000915FA60|nr:MULTISPECIES: hypothetical protein [unclassified Streptomyces]OII64619.1 hypothetical protein BJP40_19980 [Streptomyces sp. CC53]
MRRLVRRWRSVHARVVAQAAEIHQLREDLAAEQRRADLLARDRGDTDHVAALDRQIRALRATVAELRAGRPDDAQTAELRRLLYLEQRTARELHDRLALLQAANEGAARVGYDRRWAA